MIIFLDSSLITALQGTLGRAEIFGALAICAQQAREGVHLLLADRATFSGFETYYAEMDARTVATLRRSSEKLTLRKQLRDFVSRAVRIVADGVTTAPVRRAVGSREEVLLPASMVDSTSSLVGNPLLMVENLNDGHAYLKLAESIANDDVLPGFGWLRTIPLRCEIAPGGGNTLANLFSYHKALGSRTGIAVADGDYRYAGAPMGDTARALQQAASSAPVSALFETMILSVRTIENCIPRSEISRIATDLDPLVSLRFSRVEDIFAQSPFWSVVPIKSGVRCFELGQASTESMFWTAQFGGRRCKAEAVCTRKGDCDNFILPPVSDKILVRSVATNKLFSITPACLSGVADVWRQILICFYSLFCGADRTAMI